MFYLRRGTKTFCAFDKLNCGGEWFLIKHFTSEKTSHNYFISNQVLYFHLLKHGLLFVNYSLQ